MAAPVVESFSGPFYEEDALDTSITITKPAGVVSGDLLIAVLGKDLGNINYSAPAGWTQILKQAAPGGSAVADTFQKIAGASEPASYDFDSNSATGTVMSGGMLRISGHDATTPINVSGGAQASSTSIDCPSAITTVKDALILRLMAADDNVYTDNSTPAGHTVLWANDTALGADLTCGAAHTTQASAGPTGTASFTGLSLSKSWAAITIAVAPAADTSVTATADSLTITPFIATVEADVDTDVSATVDSLTIAAFNAAVQADGDTDVIATVDALTIAAFNATVQADVDTDITATAEVITLTAFAVDVQLEPLATIVIDNDQHMTAAAPVNTQRVDRNNRMEMTQWRYQ